MMTGKRRRAQLVEDAKAGELHGFAAGVACGVCGDRVQAVMAPSWAAARDGHGVCVRCVAEKATSKPERAISRPGRDERHELPLHEAEDMIVAPPVAEAIASVALDHDERVQTLSVEEAPKSKRKRRLSTEERLSGKAGEVPEEA